MFQIEYEILMSNATFEIQDSELINKFMYIDFICRIYALLVHVFYFLIIFKIKEFRSISFIFVHNVNFIGLLFILHYCFYLVSNRPNTNSLLLNEILCRLSSLFWATTKYLHSYSVLLLAFYRYLAVCRVEIHKKISRSKTYLLTFILLLWCFSLSMAFISKYIFQTIAGSVLCYDGFSTIFLNSINYYVFNAIIAIIIPCIAVVIIYILIAHKLKEISRKIGNRRATKRFDLTEKTQSSNEFGQFKSWPILVQEKLKLKTFSVVDPISKFINTVELAQNKFQSEKTIIENIPEAESGVSVSSRLRRSRSFKFPHKVSFKSETSQQTINLNKQLIAISIIISLRSFTFLLLNAGNLFSKYGQSWSTLRLSGRILTVFLQSLIPILSIIYHPVVKSCIKNILKCKFVRKKSNKINNNPVSV